MLGRNIAVYRLDRAFFCTFRCLSFRIRPYALHSTIPPFALAFYHRTSPRLPRPRRPCARCRAPRKNSVNFLRYRRRAIAFAFAFRLPSSLSIELARRILVYKAALAWPRRGKEGKNRGNCSEHLRFLFPSRVPHPLGSLPHSSFSPLISDHLRSHMRGLTTYATAGPLQRAPT